MGGTKKMIIIIVCAALLVVIGTHFLITNDLKKQLRNREKALADTREIYENNRKTLTNNYSKLTNDFDALYKQNILNKSVADRMFMENGELRLDVEKLMSNLELLKTDLKKSANFLKEFNEINLPLGS
jgi:ABC-type phosphate transport system auxiliary subunit